MKFNKLIPELSVSDIDKSLKFYTEILDFKIEYKRKVPKFVFLSFLGSQIMLEEVNNNWNVGKLEHPFGRGINLQIEVDDIKPVLDSLKKNKYKIKFGLKDNWYEKNGILLGCREFLVMDPDGYLLRFSQNIGTKKLKN